MNSESHSSGSPVLSLLYCLKLTELGQENILSFLINGVGGLYLLMGLLGHRVSSKTKETLLA
jgi:hypothetical protein